MATNTVIACPECKKKFKSREDLEGKKIRCPACNHPFVVRSEAADKGPAPEAKGKPKWEEEDDDPNPYGVTTLDLTPRCPHCANPLESADAVICLFCGYNTQTREMGYTKKVVAKTGGDQFAWLLPGFANVLGIVIFINLDIFFCLLLPDMVRGEEGWQLLDAESMRLWTVVISLFAIWTMGYYAYKRLILEPIPPEREKD
jgi:DNA-directed RNA polymerase subunit RPC12/RpoP